MDTHRFLALLGLGALALHGVALVADDAVDIGLGALFVPGASPYRPFATALGVLAAELMVLIYLSFSVRRRIGAKAWRALHWLTYLVFALGTVHGLAAGSDSGRTWALALYGAAVGAVVGAMAAWSSHPPKGDRSRSESRSTGSLCSGFGSCVDAAPELFRLGDDGIAVALVEESGAAALLDAIRSAPHGSDRASRRAGTRGGMKPGRVLVVGAGLAGSRCAEVLRAEGFEGEIVLAGDEEHPPYERPALSKELLAGRRDDISLQVPRVLARAGRSTSASQTRVRRIDVGRRLARTSARPIRWDALVPAGAHPRRLPALDGRPGVRTRADAEALRAALRPGRRLAIVGAGFVGAEVALDGEGARRRGLPARGGRAVRGAPRVGGRERPCRALPLRGSGRTRPRVLRG